MTKNRLYIYSISTIIAFGCLNYYKSMNVPWYFDDFGQIVGNMTVMDLKKAVHGILDPRGVAILTFAINYHFGEFNVFGYHIINILIHIFSGILVFWLFLEVFKVGPALSLLSSIFFIVHPVQTQSVVYIVQRMTSLSALLFLLSLFLFVNYRISTNKKYRIAYYLLSLLLFASSLLTKQNTATAPAIFILIDCLFMKSGEKFSIKNLSYIIPYILLILIAYLQISYLSGNGALSTAGKALFFEHNNSSGLSVTLSPENINLRYLATQMEVIWKYVLLFFLPIKLTLDYCFPLTDSIVTIKHILGAGGILIAISLGWRLRNSSPRITAGIFWFFIFLAVESSVIPLDPIFEHRMYLPIIGLILIIADLSCRANWKAPVLTLWIACILCLSILTIDRTALWAAPEAFWKDNIEKTPMCFRPYYALGEVQKDAHSYTEAITSLNKALELYPQSSGVLFSLGATHGRLGNWRQAADLMQQSFDINPSKYNVAYNLGVSYENLNEYSLAEKYYKLTTSIEPKYAKSYSALGVIYLKQNQKLKALENVRKAFYLAPSDPTILRTYILVCYNLGLSDEYLTALNILKKQDTKLYKSILALIKQGKS